MGSRTLVDSNVLLDVLTEDKEWLEWSSGALAQAANTSQLVVNSVIYAETSTRFSRIEDFEAALPAEIFERAQIPWPAAFLAGKCFLRYRQRGGTRRTPLPDFFIGAQAAVDGLSLLTRDVARYETYFPTVKLLSPSS